MEYIVTKNGHKIIMNKEEYFRMLKLADVVQRHPSYSYMFESIYIILPKEVNLDEADILELDMEGLRKKEVNEILNEKPKQR